MPSSRRGDPHRGLTECTLCPRLVAWREKKSVEKRAAFAGEEYWARPVPSRGDLGSSLLVVGLAPGAHGANRTGRMFSGDQSGAWLFRALHRAGLATSPDHTDGAVELIDCRITAVCHCPPPDNRPLAMEVRTCVETWLLSEVTLQRPHVVVALGSLAWSQVLRLGRTLGWAVPRPAPPFAHCAEVRLGNGPVLIGSYHPSQQNTFTGRLTEAMFDRVWARAVELVAMHDVLPVSHSGTGPHTI